MNCIAHLTQRNGKRIEQSLKEHCGQTAVYAAQCLKNIGLYHIAYLSGLLHDMGKATIAFGEYIEQAFQGIKVVKGSVIHSYTGLIYILEKYHTEKNNSYEKVTSEIIGYAIGAHHGLFDCVDLQGNNGFDKRLQVDRKEIYYDEAVEKFFYEVVNEAEIEEYFRKAVNEVKIFFEKCKQRITPNAKKKQLIDFQAGLLARMVTSAIIYGDRRDTREFMHGIAENLELYDIENIWKETTKTFENKINRFSAETPLNKIRQKISKQCFDFAKNNPDIYRLNVPTGGGKTLATLRYALQHAKLYGKKRVILIIPLLSVIDQNAKVIREYVGNNEIILEHHSNVINEKSDVRESEEVDCLQEEWNSHPIIISTLVQMLEILFSHKTSSIGRMQALSDSVIIFDEIQSLPKKVTEMFNAAMNFLKMHCNATIILSSATQPCLETVEWSIDLADNPDMVHLLTDEQKIFDRAEIFDVGIQYGLSDDEFEEFCESLIEENSSVLAICNTRAEARELFDRLYEKENENWEVFHLSTSMCQAHRLQELSSIQEKLGIVQKNPQENKKVICIATQLVEAGIDFSFQCVVRILAGLDNLTQATGRCNRSNEYSGKGKVYFVKLKNEKLDKLKEIKVSQDSAIEVLTKKDVLLDKNIIGEQAIDIFYKNVYTSLKNEIQYPNRQTKYSLSRLLANAGQEKTKYVMNQPFKTVAKEFKVFDNETVDIIVPYGNAGDMIKRLEHLNKHQEDRWMLQQILKEVKAYTISVYQYQLKNLLEYGWLEELFEGRVFVLNEEMYSQKCGLKPIVQQSVENYIF